MFVRAFVVWFGILVLAFANGTFREVVLVPWLGPRMAHATSVLLLSGVVLVVSRLSLRWLRLPSNAAAWAVGALWLGLTLLFEFGFGRLRGLSWEVLLADYDLAAGRVWPVVLATTLVSPWLSRRLLAAPPARPATTLLLGLGLLLVGLCAVAGGWYGLAGASGVPLDWLSGSPFRTYFVPSLFLFAVVGGLHVAAAAVVFLHGRASRPMAASAGVLLAAWIVMQVGVIGYVSWLQPACALAGLATFALSLGMPRLRSGRDVASPA